MKKHWHKITDQNSNSAIALKYLDLQNFWIDNSFGEMYLRVKHKEEDTWHRVFCKEEDTWHRVFCKVNNNSIGVKNGVPHWIINKK